MATLDEQLEHARKEPFYYFYGTGKDEIANDPHAREILTAAAAADPFTAFNYLNGNPRARFIPEVLAAAQDREHLIAAARAQPFLALGPFGSKYFTQAPAYREAVAAASERSVLLAAAAQDPLGALSVLTHHTDPKLNVNVPFAQDVRAVAVAQLPAVLDKADSIGRESMMASIGTQLNFLHEEPDALRFSIIDRLTPSQLYQLILHSPPLYTSSFNGIMDRLLPRLHASNQTINDLIDDPKLLASPRDFFESAAAYNRMGDVFNSLPDDAARLHLLDTQFKTADQDIQNATTHDGSVLFPAIALADTAAGLRAPAVRAAFEEKLLERYEHSSGQAKFVYGVIASAYVQHSQGGAEHPELFARYDFTHRYPLDHLTGVPAASLFDAKGRHVQQMLFYGDDDGTNSFANMLQQYRGHAGWKVEDHGTFVVITGGNEAAHRQLILVANKPVARPPGSPQAPSPPEPGIDDATNYLKQIGATPQFIIHRGHSYHVNETLQHISSDAAAVFWGSCGGYRDVAFTLDRAPNAQIISTHGTGTMYVNDPLFKMINETILKRGEIEWGDLWARARAQLGDERFREYVSPDTDLTVLFIRAYKNALGEKSLAGPTVAAASALPAQPLDQAVRDFHAAGVTADSGVRHVAPATAGAPAAHTR